MELYTSLSVLLQHNTPMGALSKPQRGGMFVIKNCGYF